MSPRTPLTYLTVDSLMDGVGVSQVLPYVERLGRRGLTVNVHSFERRPPDLELADRLSRIGVTWRAHPFGAEGSRGGARRVATAARSAAGSELLHARSDLAAAAALVARARAWVWDMRAFWVDQRIALGMLRPGSIEERVMRLVEHRAARSARRIVSLTEAAIPIIGDRWGADAAAKVSVVPTCVDLDRFALRPPPPPEPVELVMSGSLNRYYDVPTMLRLVAEVQKRAHARLSVFAPGPSPWDPALDAAGAARVSVRHDAMPTLLAKGHVGLAVCRFDAGVSLTAAVPTKLAEFLACGRPVVVNRGLGDTEELVRTHRCGVAVRDTAAADVAAAAEELLDLLGDPMLAERCRQAAEQNFDLERGVDALLAAYGGC